jgi:photosystem II stability/assembly factor-like uncharacterized protein
MSANTTLATDTSTASNTASSTDTRTETRTQAQATGGTDTDALLAVGTRKGFLLGRHDASGWRLGPLLFPLNSVYAALIDVRHSPPRLLVATDSEHYGPSLHASDDLGASWTEAPDRPIAFAPELDTAARRVWQLAPGRDSEPDVVYAGVEPTSLFRSTDGGRSFTLVEGLWQHPHRTEWEPGYGGAAVHTVLADPTDGQHITVAMSTGGVYQTTDGGGSWRPTNAGVQATFLPERFPEFGQCVHKVAMNPARPELLFLQNHGGVYRSRDGGQNWSSIADGLPADFGFSIVVDPDRPETVYLFPLQADDHRFPPDYRCRAYRSDDAGESWRPVADGLPDEPFYSIVLRDAMCAGQRAAGATGPAGVYFGTRSGELYGSQDGESWELIAEHLPDVLCVRAAVLR